MCQQNKRFYFLLEFVINVMVCETTAVSGRHEGAILFDATSADISEILNISLEGYIFIRHLLCSYTTTVNCM